MWFLVKLSKMCGLILYGFWTWGIPEYLINKGMHGYATFGQTHFCVYVSFENPQYGSCSVIWPATAFHIFPLPVPWYHAEEPQGVAAAQLISEQALMPSCQISLKACLELEATLLSGFKNSWTAMILRMAENTVLTWKKPIWRFNIETRPFPSAWLR